MSLVHAFLNAGDLIPNLLSRCRGVRRELADFRSYYGKALALLSSSCRFNGGIQGQQVGLLGNLGDQCDDTADVPGTFI
ncbi:hypothetical protein D1872_301730 [compost metagenome]